MKRTLLLVGLLIPLCWLPTVRGFSDASISVNIGGPAVAYHYWYYPEYGVYYDYDAHMYFYSEGGSWVRVRHLPPRFHRMGRHVMVEGEKGRPWARYDAHRAKYPPGQLKKEMRKDDRHEDRDHDRDKHHSDHDRP